MIGLSELTRKLENQIVLGVIHQVDESARKLRINIGTEGEPVLTRWLPWPASLGRNYIRWQPLRIGTQVIMVCESGDIANAAIVGQLFTATRSILPPSNNPDIDRIEFNDGTFIQYDISAGTLSIQSVNQINMTGPTININANELNIDADQITQSSTGLNIFSQTISESSQQKNISSGLLSYNIGSLSFTAVGITIFAPVSQSGGGFSSNGIDYQTHIHYIPSLDENSDQPNQ